MDEGQPLQAAPPPLKKKMTIHEDLVIKLMYKFLVQ